MLAGLANSCLFITHAGHLLSRDDVAEGASPPGDDSWTLDVFISHQIQLKTRAAGWALRLDEVTVSII
jgi:hypothetical protein